MISDFVKGRKQYDFPPMIRNGIVLHRAIDTFTDAHPCTHEIKKYFSPEYGLYAGPISDIVYDYFLANDRTVFSSDIALEAFTITTYKQLEQHSDHFPPAYKNVFHHMRRYNWLYNYRLGSGIMKSLNGLAHRARYLTEVDTAFSIFLNNREAIEPYYRDFFPMLKVHAENILQELLKSD